MWLTELWAIFTGLLVLANGTIAWMIYRAVCHPHPTVKSLETIRLLTATVARLKAEVLILELQKRELETTVFTLSARARRLGSFLSSERSL